MERGIRAVEAEEWAALPFVGHYGSEAVARRRVEHAWAGDHAVLWVTASWRPGGAAWATGLGEPQEVLLLLDHARQFGSLRGATVERHVMNSQAGRLVLHDVDEWDWWRVDERPASRPGEAAVVSLDLASDSHQREMVQNLLDLASPDHWAPPGHPDVVRWFGIVHDHTVIACVAETQQVAGHPHLASVATHPLYRGRGLAKDLVAAATRAGFDDGAASVSLGMRATNESARAVYRALGYRVEHAWVSGTLETEGDDTRSGSGSHATLEC